MTLFIQCSVTLHVDWHKKKNQNYPQQWRPHKWVSLFFARICITDIYHYMIQGHVEEVGLAWALNLSVLCKTKAVLISPRLQHREKEMAQKTGLSIVLHFTLQSSFVWTQQRWWQHRPHGAIRRRKGKEECFGLKCLIFFSVWWHTTKEEQCH